MSKEQKDNRFLMERGKDDIEEDDIAFLDPMENDTDIIVDDYKDLPIEMVSSSREKKLWWMGVDD